MGGNICAPPPGRARINGNVKHFVFDLTYDVIGGSEIINFFWLDKFSRAITRPLSFEKRTNSFGVRRGAMNSSRPQWGAL